MNTRWLVGLTAILTLGVLAGASLPATSQQPEQRQTLVVFDPNRTDFEKQINEGRQRFSSGDWGLFIDRQFDSETCEPAGRIVGRFTFVKSIGDNNGYFIDEITYIRPEGKITIYGAGKFSEFEGESPQLAVTGGTGAFRDASGEITVQEDVELCDKRGALITIDLGPQ